MLILVNPDDIVYVFLFSLVILIEDGLLEGSVGNCEKGFVTVVVVMVVAVEGWAKTGDGEMGAFAIIIANIAVRAIVSKDFSVIIESSYKL